MEKLSGESFARAKKGMDAGQKRQTGRRLREAVARMDTPCAPWQEPVDLIARALENERWDPFPESFNRERRAFTKRLRLEAPVYVHGDLNEDNLLILADGEIAIIDFADAVLAPICYEHALVASELFRFERPFLVGYFGEKAAEELAELCLTGLLLHDFGGDVLRQRLGGFDSLHSLQALRARLRERFLQG